VDDDLRRRARRYAALGEPVRLAIVDELTTSDRSPGELTDRLGLSSNLLAHHLDVLESAGLVERLPSSADRRRRYVRLLSGAPVEPSSRHRPPVPALFVCTHNSARSQLAAALWTRHTGAPARSAGTRPADRVHPGAVAAARRAGLDLSDAVPRLLDPTDPARAAVVVTVCDQAHEVLRAPLAWWHWSVPDPVARDHADAFDTALAQLDERIRSLTTDRPLEPVTTPSA
jgi:protein-tyrosine-phosphatase